MSDFMLFRPGVSLFGDVLWQSGLFLLVGLVVGTLLRRLPARAHRVLLVAIAAALIAPLCSQLAHHQGWGLWGGSDLDATRPPVVSGLAEKPAGPSAVGRPDPIPVATTRATGDAGQGGGRLSGSPQRSSQQAITAIPTRAALLLLWGVVSGLCLVRLLLSLILGRHVVGVARTIDCEPLDRAAGMAVSRLGLRVGADLRASDRVACPVVWCWGRRPVILLHQDAGGGIDWAGVFCHELAHWVRRDHLSGLLAELLTCLIPWHPLAWLAKHRLSQLSELACDDWAIAVGQEPAAYAETLLKLAPRRRTMPALAAVSRRSGLAGRVAHILESDGAVEHPPGRRWSGAVMMVAIGLIGVIALAQAREGRARSDESKMAREESQPHANQAFPRDEVTHREIRGTVGDASGKPVPGASIFAVGRLETGSLRSLTQVSSDREGRFTLDLELDPAVINLHVLARTAGTGLTGRNFSIRPIGDGRLQFEFLSEQAIDLTLVPNLPIEGQLLSPSGVPVSGASVSLASLGLGDQPRRAGYLQGPEIDAGRPARAPYWPEPVMTDAQGRFRLDGFSAKAQAEIQIIHADYVHESLTISMKAELDAWHKQWGIKPIPPRFSHVLEPARPIEGIVTDKDTGRPIAGVNIDMFVSRAPDWRFHFRATTDAEGRYRIVGVAWNRPADLCTNVTPAAASGYLPIQENREEWPSGSKELRWDFAINKGRLVRGRVIDADTKRPIAGAKVTGEVDSHTVRTDAQGNFSLSMNPRHRSLFVEGPTRNYQRVTVPRGEVRSYSEAFFPHGYARVDIPEGGAAPPVEIALKKGATIAAQAVDPEGKPLADVVVSGLSLYASLNFSGETAGYHSTGLFRMSSFVPGQTYRIFFIQRERRLAGFADLTATTGDVRPAPVTLNPTAAVRGRLMRPDGAPDRGRRIHPNLLLTRSDVKLDDPMQFFGGDIMMSYGLAAQGAFSNSRIDDNGEFEVDGLMAGVTHYLTLHVASNRVEYIPVEPLQPGEVRELGPIKSLVITDRQP